MELNKGDVIGSITCPDCGMETDLKLSKNMGVFYWCSNVIEAIPPDDPLKAHKVERCGARKFYGRRKSQEMVNEYIGNNSDDTGKYKDQESPKEPTTAESGAAAEAGKQAATVANTDERAAPERKPEPEDWGDDILGF